MKVLPINKHAPTRLAKYLLSYGVDEDVLFTCRSYPNDFEKVKLNKSVFYAAVILRIIRQKLKVIG